MFKFCIIRSLDASDGFRRKYCPLGRVILLLLRTSYRRIVFFFPFLSLLIVFIWCQVFRCPRSNWGEKLSKIVWFSLSHILLTLLIKSTEKQHILNGKYTEMLDRKYFKSQKWTENNPGAVKCRIPGFSYFCKEPPAPSSVLHNTFYVIWKITCGSVSLA